MKLKFEPTKAIRTYYVETVEKKRVDMGRRQSNNERRETASLKKFPGVPMFDVADVSPKQAAYLLETFPDNFSKTDDEVNTLNVACRLPDPKPSKKPLDEKALADLTAKAETAVKAAEEMRAKIADELKAVEGLRKKAADDAKAAADKLKAAAK